MRDSGEGQVISTKHQARAADGALPRCTRCQSFWHPVHRHVLVHGRDDDAVLQAHAAQSEGLVNIGGGGLRTWTSNPRRQDRVRETARDGFEKRRIAQSHVLVGDLLGRDMTPKANCGGSIPPVAVHVLEPRERHVRRVLRLFHVLASLRIVERRVHP